MRIDRLDLIAYGHFTDKSLDLSAGDSGLHLIYGDNEAGKSTSLRALIAWLFGIPIRTNDNFLHSNPQLRIGGKLKLSDDKEIEFIRRKGTKDTLLNSKTDDPLDDAILAPFLSGSIDENIFSKLWGIDHGRLIAGGKELLDQSGDLGQALFSAAVGTASLRELLSNLKIDSEEIFKPRGSKGILNQAISNFKEAQRRIKDSSLPVSEWKRLQKDLSEKRVAIDQVEQMMDSKNKEENRLNRLNRVKEALAQHRSTRELIDELGHVLLLPEDFEEKRKTAHDNLQKGAEKKERLEAKLLSLKDESDSLNVRNELIENEQIILSIYKELGAVEKTIIDRPQQDGKRRLLSNGAKPLLKSVRPDIDIEKADVLRPILNNKKWISGLTQTHVQLSQNKQNSETTFQAIKDEQESLRSELGEQPVSKLDLKGLKAVIMAARKAGDVENRLSVALERSSMEKAACDHEFERLGRFSGEIESLLKLAMPVSETLDSFDKEIDSLLEKRRDHVRRQEEVKEEKKKTEQELQALLLMSDVPTVSQLEDSRDARDKGWNLIRHKYIEKKNIEKEISEYASNSDLPTLFEQKVENADHVSDRLRLASDHVVKRADFESKIKDLNSRLVYNAEKIEKVNKDINAHQKRWSNIWEPLEIESGTPREMKQWLFKVEKLVLSIQKAKSIAQDEQNLAKECKLLRESVSKQIVKYDESVDLQGLSLEGMISLCEERIVEEEILIDRKRQIDQSLGESEIRLKRTRDELDSIKRDQSAWLEEWRQAIVGLGLKEDTHPDHASETMEQLQTFFENFDKSEELRRRIYGMDLVLEKFNQRVFEFSDGIGFKRDGQLASIIAEQLNRDLNYALESRASLNKIKTQIKEIKDEINDAEITIRVAKEQLQALRVLADVEKNDDLIIAGEKSLNIRELQKTLLMLEQELNRNGDGLSIEDLGKEFDESDIDSIKSELDKITEGLKELHQNRDQLRDELQTLQNEIDSIDGSAEAAQASEEAQEQLSAMVSNAEKYLRLQIAAHLLEQQIEEYRRKNQAPVLARAGELFSKLSLGSFANLRDELDDGGRPVLLGVRPNNEEVNVDGMSEGSRDQLYLALRLATLEQHLNKSEPMPFVVDDILIGFDDNRTKVCLEVLSELSKFTQVLLFTHHRRVLDLSNEVDTKAGIFLHELA